MKTRTLRLLCPCAHRKILTDDFRRCQRSFLHGEVAGRHTLDHRGQEQQRQDADHIHGADGQQEVAQVEV